MPDDRVPGDKIGHEVYHYDDYDDSTDYKMWQGSLPHKKGAGANNDVRFISGQRFPEIFEK